MRIVAILVLSILCQGCSSLLFYPSKMEYVDRAKMPADRKPEDLTITSEDGTKLHAWRFKTNFKKPSPCVLVHFHGNAENLSTHFMNFYSAPTQGYDYLIFDYRGYGDSEGKPSIKGSVEDGRAFLRHVHQMYPAAPLIVVGQSLGGAIGLRAVLDTKDSLPIKLVVLDSTFGSYRTLGRRTLSHSWLTWLFQPLGWLLMNDEYATKNDIAKLSPIPLVMIGGDADRTVDEINGQELFAAAGEPKEYWHIPGGRHIDFMWRDKGKWAEKFYDKLDSVCGSPSKDGKP